MFPCSSIIFFLFFCLDSHYSSFVISSCSLHLPVIFPFILHHHLLIHLSSLSIFPSSCSFSSSLHFSFIFVLPFHLLFILPSLSSLPSSQSSLSQVGVPVEVAKQLSYPEKVTSHNINLMRQLVRNGPDVHPGALFVEPKSTPGIKKSMRYVHRERMASELKQGDIIERLVFLPFFYIYVVVLMSFVVLVFLMVIFLGIVLFEFFF